METKTQPAQTNKPAVQNPPQQNVAVLEKNICDSVLARVNQFQEAGALSLPKDYSAPNALKVAFLQLTDQTAKVNNQEVPVLSHCTQASVANALLRMVTQGLNPMKRQCSFIPYGNKLTMQREYQGSIALAKRFGMKDISYQVIYEKDKFVYEINAETGKKKLIEHIQDFENIDPDKIRGAYAITFMSDGSSNLEVMNMRQIHAAWNQGAMNGNSGAHKNFKDQMCLKTVINRACKPIINSSDDSYLFDDDDEDQADKVVKEEIKQESNSKPIDFSDAEVLETKPIEQPKEKAPAPKQQNQPQQQTLKPDFE